jgi:hypothetical protein
MKKMMAAVLVGMLGAANLMAQAFGPTGTTNLNVTVASEAAIRVDTANTNLTSAGSFADFLGTTNYTYKIRTTAVGGSGSVTVQITTDFAPAGGPSVAAPPDPLDAMTYTCAATLPATACAGTITASTAAATAVSSFGANARSLRAGTGGNSVAWTLPDDPAYATGSYVAVATFTISAT